MSQARKRHDNVDAGDEKNTPRSLNKKTFKATSRPPIRMDSSSTKMDENSPICGPGVNGVFHKLAHFVEKIITQFEKYCFYYLHRNYIFKRLSVYFLLIVVAGFLKYLVLDSLSRDNFINLNFKTGKKNPLNVYFVKLGWLWTLISLVPFHLLTRYVYCRRKQNYLVPQGKFENFWTQLSLNLAYPSLRLLICTAIWKVTTQAFVHYENNFGTCDLVIPTNSTIIFTNRFECQKDGHHWKTFEISGHIFIMIFSNLMRIEELYYLFDKFAEFKQFNVRLIDQQRTSNFTQPYYFSFRNVFLILMLVCTAIMILVTLIWDFMIAQTSMFYHDVLQNLTAFSIATIWWVLVYRIPPFSWISKK